MEVWTTRSSFGFREAQADDTIFRTIKEKLLATTMYPPKVRQYKPVGDWNQVLLVVDGNKVTQVLNGEVVVGYEKLFTETLKS